MRLSTWLQKASFLFAAEEPYVEFENFAMVGCEGYGLLIWLAR